MKRFKRFYRPGNKARRSSGSQESEVDHEAFGLKELKSGGDNPCLEYVPSGMFLKVDNQMSATILVFPRQGSPVAEGKIQISLRIYKIVCKSIVAVHGLNGHREKTWRADNGVNWLKDLLPETIPNARILSYGYDARTHGFVSQQHLNDHGIALVTDLSLFRRSTETERRPIIFIAHSLGGIVCKIALIHASAASETHLRSYKDTHISTYGLLYFGTPHQGGNGVPLAKFLVNVASNFVSTNKKLLKHLEKHSEFLQQQTTHYNAISARFETKFFYETYETQTPFGSVVIVPKYSAVIPGAVNAEEIAINKNHFEIVKFHSEKDEGYRKISQVIRLMLPMAVSGIENSWRRYDAQNGLEPVIAFQGPVNRAEFSIADGISRLDIRLSGIPPHRHPIVAQNLEEVS